MISTLRVYGPGYFHLYWKPALIGTGYLLHAQAVAPDMLDTLPDDNWIQLDSGKYEISAMYDDIPRTLQITILIPKTATAAAGPALNKPIYGSSPIRAVEQCKAELTKGINTIMGNLKSVKNPHSTSVANKCQCDMQVLMTVGCQCGGK